MLRPRSCVRIGEFVAAVLGAALMLLPWSQFSTSQQVPAASAQSDPVSLLISGVLYNGYQYLDADEAVELSNVEAVIATLSGWQLCDGLACYALPDVSIAPRSRIWLARDAVAFTASFGHSPTCELSRWPRLNDDGDVVVLRAPDGSVADTLVYEGWSGAMPDWTGEPVRPYLGLSVGEAGQILSRVIDEADGLPAVDTNTGDDWIQALDPALGRRVRYVGWDLVPLFSPLSVIESATITIGVAPDSAFEVVANTLQQARSAISVEVYSLRHPTLIQMLVDKAQHGVNVSVLLEGDPVGLGVTSPEWQTELYACRELEAAGGACWFMVHDPEAGHFQRYLYLHAKLIIVDGTWVVVSTQNLTPDGMPADDKANGTYGSRGIVLVTDAPSVVQRASQVFALDLDPDQHGDLVRWNTIDDPKYGPPDESLVNLEETDGVSYTATFSRPQVFVGAMEFEVATAPEASLRRSDGLLALLQRAGSGDVVMVEQLYEVLEWGTATEPLMNPRLQAYVEAAQRGAAVRILLNGRSFIDGASVDQDAALTIAYLRSLARAQRLDLAAALGNPTGDGIHSKMVLVDLQDEGRTIHVGSINGSEASNKVNRELAIQFGSEAAFDYLQTVFESDWWRANPVFLPVTLRAYTAPRPPAAYVVVSEVAYSVSTEAEWIELYNPTAATVSLQGYCLGDAETRASYEPMFAFPAGTTITPGGTLVVAVNAIEVPEAALEFYESTATVPNMVVYPAWGTSAYPLGLRNAGDQVLLLGPGERVVDVVVWGDATYPGVVPHPGVLTIGASLERFPAGQDTDDCAADLRERYPPTPGEVPHQ